MSIASLPTPTLEPTRSRPGGSIPAHTQGSALPPSALDPAAGPITSANLAHAAPTDAHAAGAWPLAQRLAWLKRLGTLIDQHTDSLVGVMEQEIGKPRFEAFAGDILPLLSAIRWHRRRLPSLMAPRRLPGKPSWMLGIAHRVQRVPVGHVGIIATWNYPVQLLGVQLIQALAAGNRVSVKPSENAPRTQALLLDLAARAGLPAGQLTVLPATREAGRAMLEAGGLDHVVFTGSTAVGREIAAICARALIPTTLELSGRDSTFVLDDADPKLAAQCIWNAVIMNGGQTCMAPRRALVHRDVYAKFLAELSPLAAGARPRRLISPAAAARVFELAHDAVASGGRPLSGVLEGPLSTDPRCLRPIAVAEAPASSALAAGEHFGPALAIIPVSSLDEALAIHRACDQHLATSVFTRSSANVQRVISASGATVTVNDLIIPTVHPAASLTGVGPSGWGPGRGEAGLLALTRAVHVSRTSTLVRLPPQPPPAPVARRLERILRWWNS